jgi:hypothetical protein
MKISIRHKVAAITLGLFLGPVLAFAAPRMTRLMGCPSGGEAGALCSNSTNNLGACYNCCNYECEQCDPQSAYDACYNQCKSYCDARWPIDP